MVVDRRQRDERGEIVGRLGPLLLPHAAGVVEHLEHRTERRARRHALRRGMDRLGEPVERDAVLVRDAEHVGDDVRRHQPGDVLDEIALALVDHAIDDALRQQLDPRPHGLGRLRDELARHQLAQPGVVGRIRRDQHLVIADLDGAFAVGDHDRRDRRERRGVATDGLHVAVARDRPEPVAIGLVVPVHRIVGSQPRELLVGLAVRKRLRRQQGDVDHGQLSEAQNSSSIAAPLGRVLQHPPMAHAWQVGDARPGSSGRRLRQVLGQERIVGRARRPSRAWECP